MQSDKATYQEENRNITKRFIAVMYQLLGMQIIRSRKEFGDAVGLPASNLYRMEKDGSCYVQLHSLKKAVEEYKISLEYIFMGTGGMFSKKDT